MNGADLKISQIVSASSPSITSRPKILFCRWRPGHMEINQAGNQFLLLIDDLEAVAKLDFDARQNLRWLLLRGPARRVWPIITINPNRMENARPWLEAFHTRIFGPIQNVHLARQMDAENAELDSLNIGSQFAMREGHHWLRFWIPSLA